MILSLHTGTHTIIITNGDIMTSSLHTGTHDTIITHRDMTLSLHTEMYDTISTHYIIYSIEVIWLMLFPYTLLHSSVISSHSEHWWVKITGTSVSWMGNLTTENRPLEQMCIRAGHMSGCYSRYFLPLWPQMACVSHRGGCVRGQSRSVTGDETVLFLLVGTALQQTNQQVERGGEDSHLSSTYLLQWGN
jgi:hypothetical protein